MKDVIARIMILLVGSLAVMNCLLACRSTVDLAQISGKLLEL